MAAPPRPGHSSEPPSDPLSEIELQDALAFRGPWLPKPRRDHLFPSPPSPSPFPAPGRGAVPWPSSLDWTQWQLVFWEAGPGSASLVALAAWVGLSLPVAADSYLRTVSWSSPMRKVDPATTF